MTPLDPEWLVPEWAAPARVHALVTTRAGGVSQGPYRSLNLGERLGDDPVAVAHNRARVRASLPGEPVWLRQVHGTEVVDAAECEPNACADASFVRVPRVSCAVLIADCLPVVLADRAASVVAVAHAGWRGLAAGVVENTLAAMQAAPASIVAWLGPAIGPRAFEVGEDVYRAFTAGDPQAEAAFTAGRPGKWHADLYALARRRLSAAGVEEITGGHWCTFNDARFYSYRRDGRTGRMAAIAWLA